MKHLFLSLVAVFGPQAAFAQSQVAVPEDAKFVVQIDVAAFAHTEIGEKLVELTREMAEEETGQDKDDFVRQVHESLGFNPLEEIRTLTIIGSDYEDPEDDLQVMVQMRKTTGNLEGLMLGLPGYESEEVGDVTIHSAHQDDMRAYAAFRTGSDGNKQVMVAVSKSRLMEMLEDKTSSSPQRQISWTVPSGTFAQVQIIAFPEEAMKVDAAKNVVNLLESVALLVGERDSDFTAELALTATSEKKAEQIQQLVQGAKAMVGLFEEEIGDDEEARAAMEILETVEVRRDGSSIRVLGKIPQDLILKFLREEADLPL